MTTPGTEHTEIKVICAKCKKVLKITEGYGVSGVSHGLCKACGELVLIDAGFDVEDER